MKLYDSAYNIPLYNWENYKRTSDVKFLVDNSEDKFVEKIIRLFNKKHGVKLLTNKQIEDAHFSIYNELLELTDAKEDLEEWKLLTLELMRARVKALTDDSALNFVKHYEALLKTNESKQKTNDIENRLIVQKLYGVAFNPKEVTLAEYIEIVNIVKKSNTPTKQKENE